MSVTINGVTARLERDPEQWQRYRVVIQVASVVRYGLKAEQYIDPGKAPDTRTLLKGVGAAAVLCVEYLGVKYKDNIDPSCASRDAIQAFGEECRMIAELAKGLDKKLARLKKSDVLNAQERAIVERMIFLVEKGEKLTRDEGEFVNEKIAALHGSQL